MIKENKTNVRRYLAFIREFYRANEREIQKAFKDQDQTRIVVGHAVSETIVELRKKFRELFILS